jgi:hypothetical protein
MSSNQQMVDRIQLDRIPRTASPSSEECAGRIGFLEMLCLAARWPAAAMVGAGFAVFLLLLALANAPRLPRRRFVRTPPRSPLAAHARA